MALSAGANIESTDVVLDFASLEDRLPDLRDRYREANPFPHIVLDDFLLPEAARRATEEFPPVDPAQWIHYVHANERKYANRDPETWGPVSYTHLTLPTIY